ncbi:hypothetical protein B296_00038014 [Ensete ventricosum]|uniref:Uncharacterized protein n=1 Tax=Ensete ventricosum TaxID=4639 RepID=A0A426X899_ENSVE|nr:hypothetical protein B296_00038014 [Ensete ventricosum]
MIVAWKDVDRFYNRRFQAWNDDGHFFYRRFQSWKDSGSFSPRRGTTFRTRIDCGCAVIGVRFIAAM